MLCMNMMWFIHCVDRHYDKEHSVNQHGVYQHDVANNSQAFLTYGLNVIHDVIATDPVSMNLEK